MAIEQVKIELFHCFIEDSVENNDDIIDDNRETDLPTDPK